MHLQKTATLPCAIGALASLAAAIVLVLEVTLARSAPPPASAPSPHVPDLVRQYNDLEYNKPIIFFEENSNILVFYPNGDIIHRGRKVTNDRAVVRALQEILSLSPCKQTH